ncbi:VOC family protein [Spirillospora sp. NPDC048824]|uniref:VOC family protein n=1 Tax=Spirillospora sp. NPDC048824 TaxID=3364526 RepID=UPI0037148DC9
MEMRRNTQRTYPEGVTSWIDVEHRDLTAAGEFYGELFGWTFLEAGGEGPEYLVAQLNGQDVAGLAESADVAGPGSGNWNTYVAVDDADRAAARVTAAGGRVVLPPATAGDGGRVALCEDPGGVPFRLREAGTRPGAQLTNAPGTWNFSDLHAAEPGAADFYTAVFGWDVSDAGFGAMIRRPGYGDHLAATVDPGIHERQASMHAPPGFADAIGWLIPAAAGERPGWHVTFTVADRDDTAAAVERLGGTVVATEDTGWTRTAVVRDPQGAAFTASQFTPPAN